MLAGKTFSLTVSGLHFLFQLADMERFHAQVVQRLQVELNEAREQTRLPKGTSTERLESRDDRQIHAANNMDLLQHEGSEDTGVLGSKAALTNSGVVVRGNPVLLSHGNMESAMPVFIPRESSAKVSAWSIKGFVWEHKAGC